MKGDCLSCVRLGRCAETDEDKVWDSYTCHVFEPVSEPLFLARLTIMQRYGDRMGIQIMLMKPEGEEK